MKKVGFITMHLPINYGSALQTYALQNTIDKLGYDARIINYVYPNKIHKEPKSFKVLIVKVISLIINAIGLFPNIRQKKKYRLFYKKYYKLTDKQYESMEDLQTCPPEMDIYMTGSDQVWNSNFVKGDTSFLLGFAPTYKPKMSFSSSFAVDYVLDEYKETYSNLLKQYSFIGVREQSSIELVKRLTGKDAVLVCDPSLLLSKEEWMPMTVDAKINLPKKYILAYILGYSFNPYPYIDNIIDKVQRELGLEVIYINGSKRDYFKKNSHVLKTTGPLEFLKLFANASFVITTSFHGVAFATNFGVPFYGVIKKDNKDTRIMSLLNVCGLEERAVQFDGETLPSIKCDMEQAQNKLSEFRESSMKFLKNSLRQL